MKRIMLAASFILLCEGGCGQNENFSLAQNIPLHPMSISQNCRDRVEIFANVGTAVKVALTVKNNCNGVATVYLTNGGQPVVEVRRETQKSMTFTVPDGDGISLWTQDGGTDAQYELVSLSLNYS